MKTFFTSDTHFSHDNIIKYCNRPFVDIKEMNEVLIEKWNEVVSPDDTIYHLGDFCFTKFFTEIEVLTKALNGNMILILGNHDHLIKRNKHLWRYFKRVVDSYLEVKIEKNDFTLCHYAMRVWNKSHHGSYHLYGHSHGTLPDDMSSRSFDVGVDSHEYQPVELEKVISIMDKKNFTPIKNN